MSKRVSRVVSLQPHVKDHLSKLTMSMSAAVSQAVLNAYDDDSCLIRALKRRMALPPVRETNTERLCLTLDPRVVEYLEVLAAKSQLSVEETTRLAIEAYIHKL